VTVTDFLDEFGPTHDLLELRREMRFALEDMLSGAREWGRIEGLKEAVTIIAATDRADEILPDDKRDAYEAALTDAAISIQKKIGEVKL
jgi:hypothetical protein